MPHLVIPHFGYTKLRFSYFGIPMLVFFVRFFFLDRDHAVIVILRITITIHPEIAIDNIT